MNQSKILLGWVELLPVKSPEITALRMDVIELMAQAGEVSGAAAARRNEIAAIEAVYALKIKALETEARELDEQAGKLRGDAYFLACSVEAKAKTICSISAIEDAKQKA